jgi:hypothetical protein
MTDQIIAARVRELLNYDPETGIFTRKVRTAQRHQVGDRACGNPIRTGHLRVAFDSTKYLAHRVAWLYVYGKWPQFDIDHINGIPSDNRIKNLRDVPNRINRQNMRSAKGDNASGLLGVTEHVKGRQWRASIHLDGKRHHIGLYDTPEAAHDAYVLAKRKIHEGCTI